MTSFHLHLVVGSLSQHCCKPQAITASLIRWVECTCQTGAAHLRRTFHSHVGSGTTTSKIMVMRQHILTTTVCAEHVRKHMAAPTAAKRPVATIEPLPMSIPHASDAVYCSAKGFSVTICSMMQTSFGDVQNAPLSSSCLAVMAHLSAVRARVSKL
jgi:hypothetical protein